jgi:hypothetical protein
LRVIIPAAAKESGVMRYTRLPVRFLGPTLLVALMLSSSLQALQPQAELSDTIVVTGQRDREEAIHEFIEKVTVETSDQIAQFQSRVCPASFGLPNAYNDVVVSRIRRIAEAVGAPLAKRNCDPNLVVIVADDSRDFFEEFRRDRSTLFGTLELADIRDVNEAEGPVRAWQIVELHGSDGRKPQWVRIQPGSRPRPMLTGVMPTRIPKSTRRDLAISFVVFDLAATDGLTLTQIADHAAMRALARTSAASGAPSILALFEDGGHRANGLTRWDEAYLRSLYATNNTVSASQQQSNMARLIGRELDEEEPPSAN